MNTRHGLHSLRLLAGLACLLATIPACQTSLPKVSNGRPLGSSLPAAVPIVHFVVGEAGTHSPIAGATVSFVRRNGDVVPIGKTDETGEVAVQRERLANRGGAFVLICAPFFVCAAIRADEPDFPITDC